MAWDDQHKKVAIKVIGTVESNMDYGAINYNDPITVGIAQWYGTRAAGILEKMRATAVWNASSLGLSDVDLKGLSRHASNDPWWNTYYLDRYDDVNLRKALRASTAIQDTQLIVDIESYRGAASSVGVDSESNTDAFILWACAYHQSPRSALQVAVNGGGGVSLRQMYSNILAHGVLGQYKSRYEKAYAIISSGDTSGVGSAGGGGNAGIGNGGLINSNGSQSITIDGGELVITVDNTNTLFGETKWGNVPLYPCGVNKWKAKLNDITANVQVSVENQAAANPGGAPVPPGGGDAGAKALQWMLARQMKFTYRQAPGRLNPDSSGFADCSSTIYRAYMDTSGINPGTWTGDQYFRGSAVIERGRGNMSAAQKALCKPGDVIVMSWGGGYPHTDHVEMFMDSGHTIGHGGPGRGPHINNIGMLSGTSWWTVRRHG